MRPSRNAATDVGARRAITNTVTSPNLPIPPSLVYLQSDSDFLAVLLVSFTAPCLTEARVRS
jgi:hypothetical protein